MTDTLSKVNAGEPTLADAAVLLANEWLNAEPNNLDLLLDVFWRATADWFLETGECSPPLGWIGGQVANLLEDKCLGIKEIYDVADSLVEATESIVYPNND